MQAIVTTYKGPTDRSGSRIIARADAGRVVFPYDYSLNIDGNHNAAREKLCVKLGWTEGKWVAGSIPGTWNGNSGGYAHVFIG